MRACSTTNERTGNGDYLIWFISEPLFLNLFQSLHACLLLSC